MAIVTYDINFPLVLEIDDTHPTARQFLNLDEVGQALVLQFSVRKALIDKGIIPLLNDVNRNQRYLTLKLGE